MSVQPERKLYRVRDLRTDADPFGREVPLDTLVTVYPMAALPGEPQIGDLAINERTTVETVTPTRGHGVYAVTRTA
jgi:hypothetical protein